MFETTKIVIKNNKRDLISKINESPILYFFFSLIMLFSIIMFSFLTYYLQAVDTGLEIKLQDVFVMIFFVFMAKSGVDFFKNYVKPGEVTYALSTQIEHKKTISEIFYAVFLSNLFMWFSLSALFISFLLILPVDIAYPFEYFYFSISIDLSL